MTYVIVCATKLDETGFRQSLLGRSMPSLNVAGDMEWEIRYNNAGANLKGLSETYNAAISSRHAGKTLVFVHDDVMIQDYCFKYRLQEALERFDVVGVAGSTDPEEGHSSWALKTDLTGQLLMEFQRPVSGIIGTPYPDRLHISHFGPTPAECKLLDGVLLAARTDTLLKSGVRFDPEFAFHFYDLDFCQSCVRAGLKLGTYPIALIHQSTGDFNSPPWKKARSRYWVKWGIR